MALFMIVSHFAAIVLLDFAQTYSTLFYFCINYCLFSVTIFGNKLHVFEDIWQISAHRTFMFKQIYKGSFCLSNTCHMFPCILFSEFS